MVMTNRKKIVVMSALVLLLAVTAVFNFILAGTTSASASATVTTSNYFTTYRSERTATRNEEILQLDSVISLYERGSEKYEAATAMKLELVTAMENELVLESMIKSLGFSDCVVAISSSSDNVNVFINSDELTYDTALQIYNMLKNETGIVAGNIFIMPVYAES